MAKEIKSINVDPSEEQDTINAWLTFGWEFKSTQEVKTSDSSHLERRGDTIYSVTKSGDHYVKLTFERDSSIPNYAGLADLQNQYDAVPCPNGRSSLFSKFSLIVLGIGLVIIIAGANQFQFGISGSSLGMVFFGAAIIVLRVFLHIKKNKKWDKDFSFYYDKRQEILGKAKSLHN